MFGLLRSTRWSRALSRPMVTTVAGAWVVAAVVVAATVSWVSASPPASAAVARANPTGCVRDFKQGTDYFPDKAVVTDARNFTIAYHNSYKVVTVKQPSPGGAPQTYVLVQCGTPTPKLQGELAGAEVVRVPIRSVFAESTTHLPAIVDLGEVNALRGVGSEQYVVSKPVRRLFSRPDFVEFAKSGDIDVEQVLGAKPDVLLTAGTDSPAYGRLRDNGVPVVAIAEYLEATPLGQAEWGKLISTLFNREARAQTSFATVATRYHQLEKVAAGVSVAQRPKVMTGFVNSGTYYDKGGKSLTARLIADAGGTSVWATNTETGPIMVDLEAELTQAGNADIWIDGSQFWTSLADATKDEPRYQAFRPFRLRQLWVPNRVKNVNGGLDYFERGVARPDLVLADLIKVFHPELARDHQFVFYVRLPKT
jgi:iron complex transport system substrate-binding protein